MVKGGNVRVIYAKVTYKSLKNRDLTKKKVATIQKSQKLRHREKSLLHKSLKNGDIAKKCYYTKSLRN